MEFEDLACHDKIDFEINCEEKSKLPTLEEESHETDYITFSGHDQGPEAYLRWEECIENWLQSNQIPEEEKTTYAEDTLTNEAYRHWDREATHQVYFEQPDFTWEEMKKLMYEEFVEKATASSPYSHAFFKGSPHAKPRRNIPIIRLSHEVIHKQSHHHEDNKKSTNVQVQSQEEQQWKHGESHQAATRIPLDSSLRSPTSQNRGKVLDSQNRMKPNLLSLGAGHFVLRTKPFEEGGYDRILDRKKLPEDDVIREGRDVKQTNQEDLDEPTMKIKHLLGDLGELTVTTSQPRPGKKQPRPHLPVLETNQDMRSLIKAAQMIHNELRHEVNCYGFLTHLSNSSKWNQSKQSLEPEVMNFGSWPFCAKAFSAARPKVEFHSPKQARPSPQTNWRLFLGLLLIQQDQERLIPPPEPPDTRPARRRVDPVLFKASRSFDVFNELQTYVWRPGDSINQLGSCQDAYHAPDLTGLDESSILKTSHIRPDRQIFSNGSKIYGPHYLTVLSFILIDFFLILCKEPL